MIMLVVPSNQTFGGDDIIEGSSIFRETVDPPAPPAGVVLAGVKIDNVTFDQALDYIDLLVHTEKPSLVVTPNVDHICQLQKNRRYREIYAQADLVIPDGMPLIWASRFLGQPLRERVAGSDIFPALCERAAEKGYRVFLLGGLPGVAQKAATVLENRFPNIDIRGTYAPPFGFENDPGEMSRIKEMIRTASPHILFVGLGSPKQEFFIEECWKSSPVPVSMGVGASFDFVAGTKKRAPELIRRLGLEWLFRMLQEPKRLVYRYLVRDLSFFKLILFQKFNRLRESN